MFKREGESDAVPFASWFARFLYFAEVPITAAPVITITLPTTTKMAPVAINAVFSSVTVSPLPTEKSAAPEIASTTPLPITTPPLTSFLRARERFSASVLPYLSVFPLEEENNPEPVELLWLVEVNASCKLPEPALTTDVGLLLVPDDTPVVLALICAVDSGL